VSTCFTQEECEKLEHYVDREQFQAVIFEKKEDEQACEKEEVVDG